MSPGPGKKNSQGFYLALLTITSYMADRVEKIFKCSAIPFSPYSVASNSQSLSVLVSFVVSLTCSEKRNSVEDLPSTGLWACLGHFLDG